MVSTTHHRPSTPLSDQNTDRVQPVGPEQPPGAQSGSVSSASLVEQALALVSGHPDRALLHAKPGPDTPSSIASGGGGGPQAVNVLANLGMDATARAAAAVLPAVDAQDLSVDRVNVALGEPVARLVEDALRLDSMRDLVEPGRDASRTEQQLEKLRKLMLTMVADVRVPVVRLSMELVRLRAARALEPAAAKQLAETAMNLYAPLAGRLGIGQFKWELEDLAFRIIDNQRYKELAAQLAERRTDREQRIDAIIEELRNRLRAAGLEAEISGRPKHLYSIWRKMQRKAVDFAQLFDLSAVRVLVPDMAGCYAALGIVHGSWTHIPGEFDDYITRPKPNGYRSLHTAVIGPGGHTMEVQIRTFDMHREAEFGVAAHWRYKQEAESRNQSDRSTGPTDDRSDGKPHRIEDRVAWLRRVLDWQRDDGPSDFLDHVQADLWSDRIYVLTPNGDILEIPANATPLDFAYRVHTAVGHRCKGAKVNGRIVPLTHTLESGDRVEILTAKQGQPSRDWLNPHLGYLKTPRARAKVRHWFKQQDYDKNLAAGEDIYRQELKRLRTAEPDYSKLLGRFNYTRIGDLMAAIGCGDISTGQLASALQQLDPNLAERTVLKSRPVREQGRPAGVDVGGLGPVLTQFSKCCNPVPPEAIAGFITRGRGVSIHRQDCMNLKRLTETEADRLIDVSWGDIGADLYPIKLGVDAYDRRGLLRDITTVLASAEINVAAIESRPKRGQEIVHIALRVEVADLAQLSHAMDLLHRAKGIVDVRRTT